jgi:hypothetical protein
MVMAAVPGERLEGATVCGEVGEAQGVACGGAAERHGTARPGRGRPSGTRRCESEVGEGLTVGARLSARGRGGGAIWLMGQDEKEAGGLDSCRAERL